MKNVILIILDGFGASSIKKGNAVLNAKTSFLDRCLSLETKTLLSASGEEVGLSWGEMGNSEVGHLNLGTGRVSLQDLPRINYAIQDKSFYSNEFLISACNWANKNNSKLHLMGLLTNGGVHADYKHLIALLELAKKYKVKEVCIHLFTDGRDMSKKSCLKLLDIVQNKIDELKIGKIVSLIGRYYAMDRDNNWERIKEAYEQLSENKATRSNDYQDFIEKQYNQGIDDEKIEAVCFDNCSQVDDNDSIIFFNFRADRARQLSECFINDDFDKFKRNKFAKNVRFVSFVSYGNEQTPLVDVAYINEKVSGQLAEIISRNNLTQFHIAESEKFAHVTYFFNGGCHKEFNGETRKILPSPKVSSYDKIPQMSAKMIVSEFVKYYNKNKPNFSVINFANPDMVGHTGNYLATLKAIEVVDVCLKKMLNTLDHNKLSIIITADHGNAEQMINLETNEIDKQHTTNSVPMIIIDDLANFKNDDKKISFIDKQNFYASNPTGVIADISPTILNMMEIEKSRQMTGISLKDII